MQDKVGHDGSSLVQLTLTFDVVKGFGVVVVVCAPTTVGNTFVVEVMGADVSVLVGLH